MADLTSGPEVSDLPPFERLFDGAPALISVHRGPDHRFTYINNAYNRFVKGRNLLGLTLAQALPEIAGRGIIELFHEVYRSGKAVEVPESEVYFDPGGDLDTRVFYRQVVQPWLGPNGAVAGVMSFAHDVTEQVRARLRAEESERHLAYSLEMGGALGVYDYHIDKDDLRADAKFRAAFGIHPKYDDGPIPIGAFFAAIHPDDRPPIEAAVVRAIQTGTSYEASYRITDAMGVERYVTARGETILDAAGRPTRFNGVVMDMTRQHNAELTLRESEARMRAVFGAIDQGYAIAEIIADAAGTPVDYRFIEVNPLFEEMTGFFNAAGKTALDLVPDLEGKWAHMYGRVALEGQSIRFEEHSGAMGRTFNVFATPVKPHGRFAIVFRDVTAERNMQDALTKSEAEFRTITEAMPQIVFATDARGYADFYNRQWYDFTGLPLGSSTAKSWIEAFHPDDRKPAMQAWTDSFASQVPFEIEYRLRHHSGAYRWVLGRARAVKDADGAVVRWLGTCTDIHEIKVAQEQRQLMLAEMNHRVKNTLSMVHAIVSQSLRQAENIADASASIQARIGMMAQAHDRLVKSTWTQTHISEVVEAALAPHRSDEKRFIIDGPDLAVGSKQSLALTMALHELATNAIKYGALSQPGGKVCVNWKVDNGVFTFVWKEVGGPAVEVPKRRGFGSRMIENALASYFDGNAELAFDADGVIFRLTASGEGLTI
jgi:PAS domain S-box-containing protein